MLPFHHAVLLTDPDGSLYVVDMYHGIIQHKTYMTTYLRKQTLDRGLDKPGSGHGRIYRIRATSGKMEPLRDIAALQGLDLVKVLMHPNAWQRETAQRLLVERRDPATVPFLEKLTAAGSTVARIHAIWTLEGMGALKAATLVPAIKGNDAKLQASALWACTSLPPDEMAKLGPILIATKAADREVLPYLVRALGPVGNAAAFSRIGQLLKSDGDRPFVREAAVSGLDKHETAFIDAELVKSKDAQLVEWLRQGARNAADKPAVEGPSLTGADLASWQRGKVMFHGEAACFGCHSADGAGMPNLGPPLDESGWVTGKPEILAKILLHGMTGPVKVGDETYTPDADMPGLGMNPSMTDQTLADIATYIRNEWSNKGAAVPAALVARERELTKSRTGKAWTAAELTR
ncbi:MAG: cytochrome c [Verrucomicrobiaceae bacterium]|nr:MAG: cytochrome c [Verrucomicrobiaceae bacterium]